MKKQEIHDTDIVVVIPVYKTALEPEEMAYYFHNCKVLKNYAITLVAPKGMDVDAYQKENNISVEYFPAYYFENISAYNKLMLSIEFYNRFENFKYILICQTDVFIFKDKLLDWCNKGYDYIGAPWVNKAFFLFQYVLVKMGIRYALQMLFSHNIFNAVGNGGLSLRKVSTFLDVLATNSEALQWTANEDFFWSFFAKTRGRSLSRPSATEAALFSIEVNPGKLMKKQNNQLPMGIHAWERYSPGFWKDYIAEKLRNSEK